jgi:predicted nucleotidyltransferase
LTTSLLITDEFSLEAARYTDDVDVIVDIVGQLEWYRFQKLLRQRGFSISPEDELVCRMRLGELKVDFMPHDGSILGFTNRWYEKALATAKPYRLSKEVSIHVLTPPLFIATKLEAYLGRGNNDPLGSKDVEDILALFDGRSQLVAEIQEAEQEIRIYIVEQLESLMKNSDFDYAVQGSVRSDKGREKLIFQRIESLQSVSP